MLMVVMWQDWTTHHHHRQYCEKSGVESDDGNNS